MKKVKMNDDELHKFIERIVKRYISESVEQIKFDTSVYSKINKHNIFQPYSQDDYYCKKLGEALIRTYPLDKVKIALEKRCGIYDDQIIFEKRENNGVCVTLIGVAIPYNSSKEYIGKIVNTMNTYGYNQMSRLERNSDLPQIGILAFEPKYTEDISEEVREKYKYLFHTTSSSHLEKIKKYGLVPKEGDNVFMYPNRVYCLNGDSLNDEQIELIRRIQLSKDEVKNKINKQFYLLTIDISKLPKNIKMYSDPNSVDSIFTYDNIPPSAIVKYEPLTLV